MNEDQFAFLVTVLQKQNDILMMLLRNTDQAAAETIDYVHNELHMYMWEDWESVAKARQMIEEDRLNG